MSADNSRIDIWVVPTNEEIVVVGEDLEQAVALLAQPRTNSNSVVQIFSQSPRFRQRSTSPRSPSTRAVSSHLFRSPLRRMLLAPRALPGGSQLLPLVLLLLGMIMDMAALILICTPIFLPVAISIGIDPYQFGMILLINLGLGLCTPPVGACLFVGCAVGKVKLEDAVKTIWPFYIGILVALMLVSFVPAISMTLPNLLN